MQISQCEGKTDGYWKSINWIYISYIKATKKTSTTNPEPYFLIHYNDVAMRAMVSQITSLTIVYSTVYSGEDQRKHQSSVSQVFVWGIHRWPVNSPQKWPVAWKMFPIDDVIMTYYRGCFYGYTFHNWMLGIELLFSLKYHYCKFIAQWYWIGLQDFICFHDTYHSNYTVET